jgi:hypothetical protein
MHRRACKTLPLVVCLLVAALGASHALQPPARCPTNCLACVEVRGRVAGYPATTGRDSKSKRAAKTPPPGDGEDGGTPSSAPVRNVCTLCEAGYVPSKPYGTSCGERAARAAARACRVAKQRGGGLSALLGVLFVLCATTDQPPPPTDRLPGRHREQRRHVRRVRLQLCRAPGGPRQPHLQGLYERHDCICRQVHLPQGGGGQVQGSAAVVRDAAVRHGHHGAGQRVLRHLPPQPLVQRAHWDVHGRGPEQGVQCGADHLQRGQSL